jgi:hypothetical protein
MHVSLFHAWWPSTQTVDEPDLAQARSWLLLPVGRRQGVVPHSHDNHNLTAMPSAMESKHQLRICPHSQSDVDIADALRVFNISVAYVQSICDCIRKIMAEFKVDAVPFRSGQLDWYGYSSLSFCAAFSPIVELVRHPLSLALPR